MTSEDYPQWEDAHLSDLDQRLRCPICKEFFKATVMFTECAHNFCSLCIRRSISAEGVCPVCRQNVLESNLVRNSILDDLATSFSLARPRLQEIYGSGVPNNDVYTPSNGASALTKQSTPVARRTRSTACTDDVFADPQQDYNTQGNRRPKRNISSVSTSNLQDIDDNPFAKRSQTRQSMANRQVEDTGECPVCNQVYSMSRLVAHVNRCLEGGGTLSSPSPSPSSSSRNTTSTTRYVPPKLSKCVYSVMKDKQLRALLEQHGLPTHGDRITLIRRHKEFSLLYNANADLPYPKRPVEVVRQFLREERKTTANTSQNGGARPHAMKLDTEEIQSHEKRYAEQFQELIEKARSTYAKCKATSSDHSDHRKEGNLNEAMTADVIWSTVVSDPTCDDTSHNQKTS
ncbi:hypothetical protein BDF22DRAFT_742579 [Syncephalis plumigaleata]|nr:hypothetical protein BDF22DRAFT_742579 [Syncephalis plumigaleata]